MPTSEARQKKNMRRMRQAAQGLANAHRALQKRQQVIDAAAARHYDTTGALLPALRDHIEKKGIGSDPAAESRYLDTLLNRRLLMAGPLADVADAEDNRADEARPYPHYADARHAAPALRAYQPGPSPAFMEYWRNRKRDERPAS